MILELLPEDNAGRLQPGISRQDAFALVEKYNKEPFHIQHAETVEVVICARSGIMINVSIARH